MDNDERNGIMGLDIVDGISVDLTGNVDDADVWFDLRMPAGAPDGCSLDDDDYEREPICSTCNGSGEGMTDGSACRVCRPWFSRYFDGSVQA